MAVLSLLGGCKGGPDPSTWSRSKVEKWFGRREFLNGWNVNPDSSVNKKAFALSYFKKKERWDKAFMFLIEG